MTDEEKRSSYQPVIAFLEPMPIQIVIGTLHSLVEETKETDTIFEIIDSNIFDEIGAVVLIARLK